MDRLLSEDVWLACTVDVGRLGVGGDETGSHWFIPALKASPL